MEVRILGSSPDSQTDRQYASSYLVNGNVVVDAGCVGFWRTPAEQAAIRDVLLTHTHVDHIASLPIFIDNALIPGGEPVRIWGAPATLDGVHKHLFNDVVWPDFLRLASPQFRWMELCPLAPEVTIEIQGLRVTPVPVNHLVPTYGYVVSDGASTVFFGADSAETDRIWEIAHATPGPKSVIIEASFPNEMRWLATMTKHMTPAMLHSEVMKMPKMDHVVAVHMKQQFKDVVDRELLALGLPNLVIGRGGELYQL